MNLFINGSGKHDNIWASTAYVFLLQYCSDLVNNCHGSVVNIVFVMCNNSIRFLEYLESYYVKYKTMNSSFNGYFIRHILWKDLVKN